ncbi:carboxypeptidase regulatory-like domain-containing protein [Aquimarina brevivitae]|uniref:Carboxypeptidase family protein n=1 Tax=Aquimarina brevivitae TaxID=323412 RepID=A0A4V2F7J9_9FLAO|nr:carboxypeptidase regulatory-like domain-containing protein [Aquimarina brevivitae]RZT00080.1 carboxypeptidase family protein [Aquimarina brevivitae]
MQFIKYIALIVVTVMVMMSCGEDTIDLQGLGVVEGRVVQSGTNEPLENVKIATNPASSTVFTDQDGFYSIVNIPAGEYSLSAQKDGLLAEFEAISVIADTSIEVVFELELETASNRPPNAAILISPEDNAQETPTTVELVWSGSDPDTDDNLTYSVRIQNDFNSEILEFENINDTTLTVANLMFGVKYFWQVTTSDGINDPVNSTVASFTTQNPPNNRIVFTRLIEGNSVIFSADEQGETVLQLTSSGRNSFRPRRNPNTSKIAFLRSIGSQTHLFTMDEDGTNQQQITGQVGVNGFNLEAVDFTWDANGAQLLFPNQDKLYRINNDGSGLELVYQTPDGSLITEIAKNPGSNITVVKTNNLDGYSVRIFTIDTTGAVVNIILEGVQGAAGGIDISIDNTKVLYAYDVSGFENVNYRRLDTRLFIYDLTTNTATDLSTDKPSGTNDLDPRFSPNEASVIYVNTSNDGVSQQNIQILPINDLVARNTLLSNGAMPDWE